jgi:hypothetical protein
LIVYFRSQEKKTPSSNFRTFSAANDLPIMPRNRVAAHAILSMRLPDEEDQTPNVKLVDTKPATPRQTLQPAELPFHNDSGKFFPSSNDPI